MVEKIPIRDLCIVALGGGAGSVCRYLAGVYVARYITVTFPLGTLLINLTGSLLIGLLYGLAERHAWMTMEWRLLLITGICGGYTTFSSFSFEALILLREGSYTSFFLYAFGSVALGLLACLAGLSVARI